MGHRKGLRKHQAAVSTPSVVKVSVASAALVKRARPLFLLCLLIGLCLCVTKPRHKRISAEELRKAGL